MEQIFGSQWAKVGHWHHRADVLCGYCWALDSLLALEHHQIFALFMAVHPTVCGQDTLLRSLSLTSLASLSQPNSCTALLSNSAGPASGARIPDVPKGSMKEHLLILNLLVSPRAFITASMNLRTKQHLLIMERRDADLEN